MKRTLKRGLKDLKSLKRKRMKDNFDNTNTAPTKAFAVLHRLPALDVGTYSLS